MARHTRTTSIDDVLFTAADHDKLTKRVKKLPEVREDAFFTPNSNTNSPQNSNNEDETSNFLNTTRRNLSTEFADSKLDTTILERETMSSITYSDIKDVIPRYDGERANSLDEFIQIVDSLASQLTEAKDKLLFNLSVKSHLSNKAFNSIRHLNNATWEQIKQNLKDKLNPLDATTCYNALTHAKQGQSESMTDFALRVENLLTNLNRSSTIDADETTRRYVQTNNEKLAKRAFENGILNFKLKTLSIAINKNTLEDAIKEVLDLDSSGEYRNTEKRVTGPPTNAKFCIICKRKGHVETDCFKKVNIKKEDEPIEHATNNKFCKYCKKKGHEIQECQAREKNNERKNRTRVVHTEETDDDDSVTLEELIETLN